MRTVIARIFDYSLDGIVAEEGTSFFDFCRILPDDPTQIVHEREFFANADVHIMGRKHYQDAAQYFPEAVDSYFQEGIARPSMKRKRPRQEQVRLRSR